jgi:hypothetical protein
MTTRPKPPWLSTLFLHVYVFNSRRNDGSSVKSRGCSFRISTAALSRATCVGNVLRGCFPYAAPEPQEHLANGCVSRFNNGGATMSIPKTDPTDNTRKDPDEWVSGDDPMTGAQASYLKTLCEQAGTSELYDDNLTKAEASKLIDEMREKAHVR